MLTAWLSQVQPLKPALDPIPCHTALRLHQPSHTGLSGRSPTFTSPVLRAAPDCRYSDYDCSPSTFSTVSSALRFCTFCLAVAMFAGFLYRTLRQLRNRPYRWGLCTAAACSLAVWLPWPHMQQPACILAQGICSGLAACHRPETSRFGTTPALSPMCDRHRQHSPPCSGSCTVTSRLRLPCSTGKSCGCTMHCLI